MNDKFIMKNAFKSVIGPLLFTIVASCASDVGDIPNDNVSSKSKDFVSQKMETDTTWTKISTTKVDLARRGSVPEISASEMNAMKNKPSDKIPIDAFDFYPPMESVISGDINSRSNDVSSRNVPDGQSLKRIKKTLNRSFEGGTLPGHIKNSQIAPPGHLGSLNLPENQNGGIVTYPMMDTPQDLIQMDLKPLNITKSPAEPTAAVSGNFGLFTANIYTAISRDSAVNFSFLNLSTIVPPSPSDGGTVNGDQWSVYVPSKDIFILLAMHSIGNSNLRNSIRISIAQASEFKKSSASSIVWCDYYLKPTQIGAADGFMDRPNVAIGKDFAWFNASVFNLNSSGALTTFQVESIFAISINELASCSPSIGLHISTQPDIASRFTVGAQSGRMFWGNHVTNEKIRIRSRSESTFEIPVPIDVLHVSSPPIPKLPATPICNAPNGINLCSRANMRTGMVGWAANNKIGFLWDAPQGVGGFGTFNFPYVQQAVYSQTSPGAAISESHWSGSNATFMYPSVGVNARGHRGGSMTFMLDGSYPDSIVWVDDDFGNDTAVYASSSNAINVGWGDYYSSQPHNTAQNTWVSTGQVTLAGMITTTPQMVWFGRRRDANWRKVSKLGLYRPSTGTFFLDDNDSGSYQSPPTDSQYTFDPITVGTPLTGDFIGNGISRLAKFSGSSWKLDMNGNGISDIPYDKSYTFGLPTDKPIIGRWTSDGIAKIGVFRYGSPASWSLDLNGTGAWEGSDGYYTSFGSTNEIPIVGDWNGNGIDDIGTFNKSGASGKFYLDYNENRSFDGCTIDRCYTFGYSTDIPIVGDWDGNGKTKIGVARANSSGFFDFYLDYDGSGTWTSADLTRLSYGYSTDVPISGTW